MPYHKGATAFLRWVTFDGFNLAQLISNGPERGSSAAPTHGAQLGRKTIMKRIALAALLTTATATSALAAGLDRSNQSILPVFDDPGTINFSIAHAMPDVTGSDALGNNYDVAEDYTTYTFSYTNRFSDSLSFSIIGDQPFGADILYNGNPASSVLGGVKADINTDALAFLLRYKINSNVSVFGGPRLQRAGGEIALNGQAYARGFAGAAGARGLATALETGGAAGAAVLAGLASQGDVPTILAGVALGDPAAAGATTIINGAAGGIFATDVTAAVATATAVNGPSGDFVTDGGYSAILDQDWGLGYSIGAAYEIPEIALRLAVSYNSTVEHDSDTVENSFSAISAAGVTTFETPQSVNVDFQTGINEKTLLLASYRWSNWGDFDVIPPDLGSDLANLDDGHRWTLGLARRFSEDLVGLASLTYEKEGGAETVSPLGPTDGIIGLSLGGRYTSGNMNVSGGVSYSALGNANAGVGDVAVASFRDNSAIGFGFKLQYNF